MTHPQRLNARARLAVALRPSAAAAVLCVLLFGLLSGSCVPQRNALPAYPLRDRIGFAFDIMA